MDTVSNEYLEMREQYCFIPAFAKWQTDLTLLIGSNTFAGAETNSLWPVSIIPCYTKNFQDTKSHLLSEKGMVYMEEKRH